MKRTSQQKILDKLYEPIILAGYDARKKGHRKLEKELEPIRQLFCKLYLKYNQETIKSLKKTIEAGTFFETKE